MPAVDRIAKLETGSYLYVWEFTTIAEVRAFFPALDRYLGRRRAFWRYLLAAWAAHGIA